MATVKGHVIHFSVPAPETDKPAVVSIELPKVSAKGEYRTLATPCQNHDRPEGHVFREGGYLATIVEIGLPFDVAF